jgi:glutathione S-transferase
MAAKQPDITVFYLESSRAIRPVWLLEALGVPYALEITGRDAQGKIPQAFVEKSGSPTGMFPVIRDGSLVVYESGAITEYVATIDACVRLRPRAYAGAARYICDNYDAEHRLIPADPVLRARTQIFTHAAEGTVMLHVMSFYRFHSGIPAELRATAPDAVAAAEAKLAASVKKDFDWLERELAGSGAFLVGDQLTAADISMHLSVRFPLRFKFGTEGGSWPNVEAWLTRCEETESYKRAVAKTGFEV